MGLLPRAHPVSTRALTVGEGLQSQRAKEKTVVVCEMQPIFPMSLLSALAGELVKNICGVFCQRKMSSLARVTK